MHLFSIFLCLNGYMLNSEVLVQPVQNTIEISLIGLDGSLNTHMSSQGRVRSSNWPTMQVMDIHHPRVRD